MNMPIGLIIEILVAVLMVIMIGYCVILNSRLRRLRTDEAAFRSVIGELIAATQSAERAIEGLKMAADDCGNDLAVRLQEAERLSIDLSHHTEAGNSVISRIAQIIRVADPAAYKKDMQAKNRSRETNLSSSSVSNSNIQMPLSSNQETRRSRRSASQILDEFPEKFSNSNRRDVA